jgi:hypothetical protein
MSRVRDLKTEGFFGDNFKGFHPSHKTNLLIDLPLEVTFIRPISLPPKYLPSDYDY